MHPPSIFRDPERPLSERIDDLIGQLTTAEKIRQLMHENPAVPRLGLPAYNWWNECCHGVGRNGRATVFPQNIGLAATFDRTLLQQIGDAIAAEARAKHHAAARAQSGATQQYQGLTFWAPNINLFRDPRWGRGQETFGEDPCLTGELACAFVRGLQGDHPHYLKVAACAKHLAVHSGPEAQRHGFDARVSLRDLHESYLPHFEKVVRAGVEAVMGAYNRTNGEPCCASASLMRLLREDWGFAGHFVSDCGAVDDFHRGHHLTPGPVKSAALALRQGCDLNCGCTYHDLTEALRLGAITMAEIDRSLRLVLRTKFRLGLFDPPAQVPGADTPLSFVHSPAHRTLARTAAVNSIVLLKNNGVLPLAPTIRSLMITGPGATSVDVLLGNYFGLSPQLTTILEGITQRAPEGMRLGYGMGCLPGDTSMPPSPATLYECACADLTIAVLGTQPIFEGEEGDAFASRLAGDRAEIELPAAQRDFLEKLRGQGKPVVLLLTGGGAIACPEAHEWCDAILHVGYPGGEGGHAVAEVLFGEAEPGGRLPVTVPRATADLPPFADYAMRGRTYRFATAAPLYPFGYGLSYTTWTLGDFQSTPNIPEPAAPLEVSVLIRNTGPRPGRTVLQFYVSPPSGCGGPSVRLVDFVALELAPGAATRATARLPADTWTVHGEDGRPRHTPGGWRVFAAFSAPVERARELGVLPPLHLTVAVK